MSIYKEDRTHKTIIRDSWIGCLPSAIAELIPSTWMRIWLEEWSPATALNRCFCCDIDFLFCNKESHRPHPSTHDVCKCFESLCIDGCPKMGRWRSLLRVMQKMPADLQTSHADPTGPICVFLQVCVCHNFLIYINFGEASRQSGIHC